MLWGQLLAAVPGSRLVLKASAQSDNDTQRLLRRRMLRQGLDPDRVDWLALTRGPVEHMEQYSQVDIALDPIPNGGCTTPVKHCGWVFQLLPYRVLITSVE